MHTGHLDYCVLGDTLVRGCLGGYFRGPIGPLDPRTTVDGGFFMKRRPVSKYKSAGKFRGQVRKTKKLNVSRPGRGGFRI